MDAPARPKVKEKDTSGERSKRDRDGSLRQSAKGFLRCIHERKTGFVEPHGIAADAALAFKIKRLIPVWVISQFLMQCAIHGLYHNRSAFVACYFF